MIRLKREEFFNMIRSLLLAIGLLVIGLNSFSQINDLERKVPQLQGKERVHALADLSYYYSSSDVNKGIIYGQKAFGEACKLNDPALQAQVLSDWSISYYNKGVYDSVLLLMKKAMPLAKKSGEKILVAKVYNKLALAHFEKGEFKKALTENLIALNIFESFEALTQVTQLQINIGAIYEKTRNFKEAENYYQKALKSGLLMNDPPILVSVYGNLGVLYMKMNHFQQANEMYFNCLEYIDKDKDLHFLCTIYQNIGVNLRNQGKIQEGLNYYLKAKLIAEKLKSKSALTPLLNNIGQCYLDLKEFEQGESNLRRSLILSKEINSYLELRNAYKGLTRLEHLRGNYEKADQYFDNYIDYQDSIYSEKNNQSLNELSVKYKTAEKEKAFLKERLKTSEFRNWIWVLGLLFVIVLLAAFSIQMKRISEKRKFEVQNLKDLEFERMRISRDLHDNIGAELTLITSKLDIKAASTPNIEEKKKFNELASLSRGASGLLRETIWSIRQDAIQKGDLLEKISLFAQKRSEGKLEMCSELESDPNEEIISSKALHLYRIAQEAINNVVKYSKATRIDIKFSRNSFTITDNGIGFNLSNYSPGYGIQNMKQRTEEMGAEFFLTSTEKGTTVRIEKFV